MKTDVGKGNVGMMLWSVVGCVVAINRFSEGRIEIKTGLKYGDGHFGLGLSR